MTSLEKYEYAQLCRAYRRLIGSKSLTGQAGDKSILYRLASREEDAARATLRGLKAYQPKDHEYSSVSGSAAILAFVRKSRPAWKFVTEGEAA